MGLKFLLAVALGGGAGSVLRYAVAQSVQHWLGRGFPWGTLTVNLAGGLLMGLISGWLAARGAGDSVWRGLLLTGFLGGFTTFSAFSLETWNLLQEGALGKATFNAVGSVILCVAAVGLGLALARWSLAVHWPSCPQR